MGEEQSSTMAPQGDPNTAQSAQSTPLLQSYHHVFPFLKLPRELRDKVYRSVLVHDCRLAPSTYVERRLLPQVYRLSEFHTSAICAETQIFRVNQQIYDEARETFLAENVFEYQETYELFDIGPKGGCTRTPRYKQERKFCGVDAVKNARHIRAKFIRTILGNGNKNDLIADFINLLAQNQHLRSLELRFEMMTASFIKDCQEVLPKLEVVKVRDSVVFEFESRRDQTTRREREFEEYLGVLKEKMLAK